MSCKSCSEKRVRMYVARGMSRGDAEERAERIMPLIEKAIVKRRGNPTDYTLDCQGIFCLVLDECRPEACPEPLPNSHLVLSMCICKMITPEIGMCQGIDQCYYDCDEDFEWDGEACVPIVVPAKPLINKPLVNPILVNVPVIR